MTATTTYAVDGMSCGGCAKKIRSALEAAIPGLSAIDIDPRAGRVQITADVPVSDQDVRAAVDEIGFLFVGVLS